MNVLKKIPGFVFEIVIIIVLSTALAFIFNHYRNKPVPFNEQKNARPAVNEISLKQSTEMFKNGETLFIDARNESEFKSGHIKNAINIPGDNTDAHAIDLLNSYKNKNTPMVVYCDGTECDQSLKTSEFLKNLGYNDVNILVNGWSLWKDHNADLTNESVDKTWKTEEKSKPEEADSPVVTDNQNSPALHGSKE